MPRVESSILINRPLAEVFAIACAYDHDTKWRYGVHELTFTPVGSLKTGCCTREVINLLGWRLVTEGIVTGYEENVRVDFRSLSGPMNVLNWRVVEYAGGDEQTNFTYGLKTNFSGSMRLFDGLLQQIGQRQVEGDLRRLKALIETSQLAPSPLRRTVA